MDSKHSEALLASEALAARGATAPRISLDDIKASIAREHYFTAGAAIRALGHPTENVDPLDLLTICVLALDNGWTVIGKSASVSAENFDEEKGKTFAKDDAIRQIWPLMAFALRDRLHGEPERIATVAHEVNRAWCVFNGDDSQPHWTGAPDWQRESAVEGVRFHQAHPSAGDSASHDNWLKHKLAEGWTYGPVKDPAAKTHPCMVPFDQLPPVQQFKDRLFRTIVHAFRR